MAKSRRRLQAADTRAAAAAATAHHIERGLCEGALGGQRSQDLLLPQLGKAVLSHTGGRGARGGLGLRRHRAIQSDPCIAYQKQAARHT